jgi:hypothetical protein
MNAILPSGRCDECGRGMEKAQRVHKGQRYCTACYARVFKRCMCPKCGNYARLHKNDAQAVCKTCETDKPCIRCGKTEYAVGKVTPYGPVCNSCVPHFREMKPCGLCARPSYRLTRVLRAGIEVPACPKCARMDHGTCSACRRNRLLQPAANGELLCRACLEKGDIPCPSCSQPMPAGRGKECEACYWQGTFKQRLKLDQAAFSMPGMQQTFEAFGEWLLIEIGGKKAALSIHRYLPFFVEIAQRWGRIPVYADLLTHFGAEGLRRVRLPMRWLNEAMQIVPDADAREADSDRRRIAVIMASVPDSTPVAKALANYYVRLVQRVSAGNSTLRSVRLALRPAASLLQVADKSGLSLPDQAALNRYLLAAPGQKAAITGFVNFLNEQYGLGLLSQINAQRVSNLRRKKLEAEMLTLTQEVGDDEESRRRWLSVALVYFHGLPKRIGKIVPDEQIEPVDGGYIVAWEGQGYWIPRVGGEN